MMKMRYCILKKQNTTAADFVEFWARTYTDKNEPIYSECIRNPLTKESVRNLFTWKAMAINRTTIKEGDNKFVEAVVDNLGRFQNMPLSMLEDADKFLTTELKDRGMIWKIFVLHILHPDKYPIFDQHVYRAMVYLKTGEIKEIPESNEEKQLKYINEYLSFYNEHGYYEDRKLDKALFSFGQFLKTRWGSHGTENSQ